MNGPTEPPPERRLLLERDTAADLLQLLGRLDEVLRHGGHDLREDIAERYTPTTLLHLLDELDTHSVLLHHALHPTKGPTP